MMINALERKAVHISIEFLIPAIGVTVGGIVGTLVLPIVGTAAGAVIGLSLSVPSAHIIGKSVNKYLKQKYLETSINQIHKNYNDFKPMRSKKRLHKQRKKNKDHTHLHSSFFRDEKYFKYKSTEYVVNPESEPKAKKNA